MTYESMKADLHAISEDDAIRIYHDLKDRFHWAGTIFVQADVEQALHDEMSEMGKFPSPDMAEAVWDRVNTSYLWINMVDGMVEHGWECLSEAVREAIMEVTPDE